MMNEFVGLATHKKELKRTFDIIDKSKTGRVRLEDIKSIAQMLENDDQSTSADDEGNTHLPPDEMKLR
jgi:Ca2+-binding EF-hand superfamily protein